MPDPQIPDTSRQFLFPSSAAGDPVNPEASDPSSGRLYLPTVPPPVERGPDTEKRLATIAAQAVAGWPDLPGYDLLSVLGRGGMGMVYKARQVKVNRLVALKMVLAGKLATPEERLRFLIEGEILGRLQHPHIVQIYEVGTYEGQPFFALEYVEGGNLAEQIKKGPLTPRQAAELTETLARAMHYAHSNGIVHRDLKPANILLAWNPTPEAHAASPPTQVGGPALHEMVPKITDFGLAKQTAARVGMTSSGVILGTPAYMAPEQVGAQEVTPATDVYALGAILYEMLTGRPPFVAPVCMDILLQVVTAEPPTVSSLRQGLPQDLVTICHKSLAKIPSQRYTTAEALAQDLRRFLEDRPIHARPVGQIERGWRWCRRNPVLATLAGLVVATFLLGTVVAWLFAAWAKGEAARADLEANRAKAKGEMAQRHAEQAQAQAQLAQDKQDLLDQHLYMAHMNLAQRDWAEDAIGPLRNLLDKYLPQPGSRTDRRGLEWYYWQRRCHAELGAWKGHTHRIYSTDFSPDGTLLVSGSADGTLRGWEVASQGEKFCIPVGAGVYCLQFHPDGKVLASGSTEGAVREWTLATGKGRLLGKHRRAVVCVCYSPEGRYLASAAEDGTIKVWDLVHQGEAMAFTGHRGNIFGLAFSPDGSCVASGSWDNTIKCWSVKQRKLLFTLRGHTAPLSRIAYSPDGKRLASSSWDRTVREWDMQRREQIACFRGHTDVVTCVAYSQEGHRLASGSFDQTVRVWDCASGQQVQTFHGHTSAVENVRYSPTGRHLATCSWDLTVKLWEATAATGDLELRGHQKQINMLVFTPDGSRLASTSQDQTLRLWDALSGKVLMVLPAQGNQNNSLAYTSMALSPDGKLLAYAASDGLVRVRTDNAARELIALPCPLQGALCLAFAPQRAFAKGLL
jgi:WD40 repeat protein/serine/threonine protein kinase